MNGSLGKVDRIVRLVIGLALVYWCMVTRNYLGLFGFVLILTAGIAWCPLYALLHVRSNRTVSAGNLAHRH